MILDERLKETEINRNIVFDGKIFKIAQCKAELCDGTLVDREFMIHSGGVCILPVDDDGNVYLVQQYRYGAGRVLLEIPAGKLEKGEIPYDCAVRELSEETGFSADKITPLGVMFSSPAIMSEIIYLYLARNLTEGKKHLDNGEFLELVKIPFDEALEMVANGEITDAKTQLALLKAKCLGGI